MSDRKIPIPDSAVRDTQRPPSMPSLHPPAVGEQVLYVLGSGPNEGQIRSATVIGHTKDAHRVELSVITDRKEDDLDCPLHVLADWNDSKHPGTWHRP